MLCKIHDGRCWCENMKRIVFQNFICLNCLGSFASSIYLFVYTVVNGRNKKNLQNFICLDSERCSSYLSCCAICRMDMVLVREYETYCLYRRRRPPSWPRPPLVPTCRLHQEEHHQPSSLALTTLTLLTTTTTTQKNNSYTSAGPQLLAPQQTMPSTKYSSTTAQWTGLSNTKNNKNNHNNNNYDLFVNFILNENWYFYQLLI